MLWTHTIILCKLCIYIYIIICLYDVIHTIGNVNVYIDCMYIKLNRRIICLTDNRMESNLNKITLFALAQSYTLQTLALVNCQMSFLAHLFLVWVLELSSDSAWATKVTGTVDLGWRKSIAVSTCLNHSLGGNFSTTTFPFGSLVQITLSMVISLGSTLQKLTSINPIPSP